MLQMRLELFLTLLTLPALLADVEERTFVMVKPDGVQRGLVGEVISRLERRGLRIVEMRMMNPSKDLVEEHYAEHSGRSFYSNLVSFMTSGPVVASIWKGRGAVKTVRSMLGATDPVEAVPGSIRGDLALDKTTNLVHASDSVASAQREERLWFRGEHKLKMEL